MTAPGPATPTSIASPTRASTTRGPARKLRDSTRTPTARSMRPEVTPRIAGACVRFVMKPMRTTSPRRPRQLADSAAAHAPPSRSRREITIVRAAAPRSGFFGLQERVQAALGLALTGPPACALVLALFHGLGARPAADREVALGLERVLGDAVLLDVRAHLVARHRGERMHFDGAVLGRLQDRDVLARAALVAPQAADPPERPRDPGLERIDLVLRAAEVRVAAHDVCAVLPEKVVALHLGARDLDLEAERPREQILVRMGLVEEKPRVDHHDGQVRRHAAPHVQQDAAARAERRREEQPVAERLHGEGEALFGCGLLQARVLALDVEGLVGAGSRRRRGRARGTRGDGFWPAHAAHSPAPMATWNPVCSPMSLCSSGAGVAAAMSPSAATTRFGSTRRKNLAGVSPGS